MLANNLRSATQFVWLCVVFSKKRFYNPIEDGRGLLLANVEGLRHANVRFFLSQLPLAISLHGSVLPGLVG